MLLKRHKGGLAAGPRPFGAPEVPDTASRRRVTMSRSDRRQQSETAVLGPEQDALAVDRGFQILDDGIELADADAQPLCAACSARPGSSQGPPTRMSILLRLGTGRLIKCPATDRHPVTPIC
jgi:hypothetical protein